MSAALDYGVQSYCFRGFAGMAVIEYEADPENPVPALKECVAAMRQLVG